MNKIVYAVIGFAVLTGSVFANSEKKTAFKKMDTDQDGQVTLKEYQAFFKVVFKVKDKNKDGVLDFDEFANSTAFSFADKNKDKKIDPAEDQALRAHHFAKLDANNDGHLTLEEFTE